MKLVEFLEATRSDLERFEAWWKRQNGANPDVFPMELSEGDWFEQLLLFWNSGLGEEPEDGGAPSAPAKGSL